jgi:hypothetical protein
MTGYKPSISKVYTIKNPPNSGFGSKYFSLYGILLSALPGKSKNFRLN